MRLQLRFALFFCFLIGAKISIAQMAYTFSASSGSFTANASPTVLHSINSDDALSPATNIGFTFTFNCQTYTQFEASTNGWLGLGTGASSALYTNDLNNSDGVPIIAPLWDDLSTNSASSSVNYELTGVAPNRVLTVEWLNMKWDYNSAGAAISFQAKFYETSNRIEFVYSQGAAAVNSGSASIGISVGTAGNWYSLNGTGTSPSAVYGVEYWNLSTKPANGQIYTWNAPVTMTYTSCTVEQPNTTSVSKCGTDQNIIRIQVVTSGDCTPLLVTQIRINMTGSTIPGTNTNDVSRIHIYYTKTNAYFSPANEFVAGGITPATGTITANGSQALQAGTNYFWIAYDINTTTATIGNLLDARCLQMTVGGVVQTPAVTSPAGTRSIAACTASPGGVSEGLGFWVKSSAGTSTTTNGALMSGWNDQSGNGRNATQATAANQPTFLDNATSNLNYYPTIDFDDASQAAANGDYMDILSNNILPANNDPYVVYSLIVPSTNNSTLAPGKFLFSGSGINQFVAFDVRSSGIINDSWDLNDLIVSGQWSVNEILLNTFNYDFSTRTMYKRGTLIGTLTGNNRQSTNLTSALGCQTCVTPHIEFYDGKMVEIITYPNTSHSTTAKNKIESYLGIKYGTTLSHDYVSSTNNTVWSLTANAAYNNNIIAIGRDDYSGLNHRQSKSTMPTQDILILSVGPSIQANQANNTGSFSSGDHSFFFSGHNAASATFAASAEDPVTIGRRLGREWYSQKTNFTNGDLTLTFDLSGAGTYNPANICLLVDADGDFTNATVLSSPTISMTFVGNILTVVLDASNFTATPYYTVALIDNSLPVQFVSLNAFDVNGKVQIDWSTGSENDNKHFEVERSKDGVEFMLVQKVAGIGNSNSLSKYSVVDNDPYFGLSYYRVKQVDQNGTISYSNIDPVEVGIQFQIYPNPVNAKDISSVKIYSANDNEEVLINIYDPNGKEVLSKKITTGISGSSLVGFDFQHDLSAGLYLVTATTNNKVYELKLIVK